MNDRLYRSAKNFRMAGWYPESCIARENMEDTIREAILESDYGASVAETIAALERVSSELKQIALHTTQAYRMIQDYKIDIHGNVVAKEEGNSGATYSFDASDVAIAMDDPTCVQRAKEMLSPFFLLDNKDGTVTVSRPGDGEEGITLDAKHARALAAILIKLSQHYEDKEKEV